MNDENRNDEGDWLSDAFDRALRGDNGVAPDAARPAANPFGVTPQPTNPREDAGPVGHNELDLDFETESTVPPQAFLPVVDFGDELADDNEPEPDPFAVFRQADPTEALPTFPQDEPQAPAAPLIQPTASAAPEHIEALPTEALDAVDAPTVVAPISPAVEPTPTGSVDGLDSLFGDDKFSDATTALIGVPAPAAPSRPAAGPGVGASTTAPAGGPPKNLVIYGIAAGVTVLLGIGGFILGSALNGGGSATPEPTVTETAAATAPRDPGTWAWDALYGGECIDPFPGAWAEKFDVVDCATPHSAQLVAVRDLGSVTGGIYPGSDQVGQIADAQCSSQGVLNLKAAGAYPNMQITAAYAPTQEAWDAGQTSVYCFVSLADASPITGSVQGDSPEITQ